MADYSRFKIKVMKRKLVVLFLFLIFAASMIYNNDFLTPVSSHSSIADPKELFSLWNDTNIIVDGNVNFNLSSMSTEWSSSAIHSLIDSDGVSDSYLFLMNNNSHLSIGFDALSYSTENPANIWGAAIYIDKDHNGFLNSNDRSIMVKTNSSDSYLLYMGYSENLEKWVELESTTGLFLSSSKIEGAKDYATSYFSTLPHHQYEFIVPFNILGVTTGQYLGMSFELFEDYSSGVEEISWPYAGSNPADIRNDAALWGDIFLGEELNYSKISIENNFNIKESAIGKNNGSFLAKADIDGDSYQELIVISNRTISGEDNLIAIYDMVDNELIKIWSSWTSTWSEDIFHLKAIVGHDFNADGEDELYGVGLGSQIIRLYGWDDIANDFDFVEIAFSHSANLMGYIAIGNAVEQTGTDYSELVFGDEVGYISVLVYDDSTDTFTHDKRSPFQPKTSIDAAIRIHAVDIADMDNDTYHEVFALIQNSLDNSISQTELNIFQRKPPKFVANEEDDLPDKSSISTYDYFGHSILIEDVDNDASLETIIIGKNKLKIFGLNTFDGTTAPLELNVNDYSNPSMGGGAIVADYDADGLNELIVGCNNGTLLILNITDLGADTAFSYNIEWQSNIGSCPGKREAMLFYDIDQDLEQELIIADNFGQIFIFGNTTEPIVTITSPTTGFTTSRDTIVLEWQAEDDVQIHHFDIEIEGVFFSRISGSQEATLIKLSSQTNTIEIFAVDTNGKVSSDSIIVEYAPSKPEIYILTPDNFIYVNNDSVILQLDFYAPNSFDHYEIYQNGNPEDLNWLSNSYELTFNSEGLINITVIVVDGSSNRGKSSIFITRDISAPNLNIDYPSDGAYIKTDFVELRWTATDDYTDISYFEVYKDSILYDTVTNDRLVIDLDLDREYQFEVIAFDLLGNNQSRSITLLKDATQPNVFITSHESGSTITTNSIFFAWNTFDNIGGSGIEYTKVFVNNELKYFSTGESTVLNFNSDGLQDIVVTSYDRAGNSRSEHIALYVDTGSPSIEILSPYTNYTTGLDYISLSWYTFDSGTGIKEVQILVNDVPQTTIVDIDVTNYQLNIPINTLSEIKVIAFDYLDNSAEDSIIVTQNSTLASVLITNPSLNHTYQNSTDVQLSWDYANIDNIQNITILVDGVSFYNTTDNTTKSVVFNLGSFNITDYSIFNITVVYYTLSSIYSNTTWIQLDQNKPLIIVTNPANNSIILNSGVNIQWSGYDPGVGIKKYILLINSIEFNLASNINHYYYDFQTIVDDYTIKLRAIDLANNFVDYKLKITLKLASPEIALNISQIYYTQTGEITLNVSILNPQTGIKKFQILLDGVLMHTTIAYPEMIITPTSELFNLYATNYTNIYTQDHSLNIYVIDNYDRETLIQYTIIVDNEPPTIIGSIIFDATFLSGNSIEIEKNSEGISNKHNLSVALSDNHVITDVFVIIKGENYTHIYPMDEQTITRDVSGIYYLEIDFSALNAGDYNLTIITLDEAGNNFEIELKLTIKGAAALPWFLEGNNLFYFIGILSFLILLIISVSSIATKVIRNRNWHDEIVAVLYIKSTGLTCVSERYLPELIQEEQLIGGAMVAIQGLLEDLREGSKKKLIQLDVSSYTMLLYYGDFGLSALIVKKLKPKHKSLVKRFTIIFEFRYKESLKELYFVDSSSFEGSTQLVEQIFGPLPIGLRGLQKLGIARQLESLKNQGESKPEIDISIEEAEKTPIEDLVDGLTKEAKYQIMKVIEKTPEAIIKIVESKFDLAEKDITEITNALDLLLRLEARNTAVQLFINSLMGIIKELLQAIAAGRRDRLDEMKSIIEKASNKWFEDIAEKWSKI